MSRPPLDGIRVLDFCWIGAGALVTKTLAELGARVYRVESRKHPDNLRLAPPFRPGTEGLEASGYFATRNSTKQSIAINMATDRGREIAMQLASRVDLVTSNFRPGIMEKWGLSYDDVRDVNPSVIYLTMPMQGAEGPHASYIGFGSTIAALSGLVHLSGDPSRTPIGTGTHYPDHVPNPGHALVAVLAALRHRNRTGEGQSIELSQFESTVNVLGPAVIEAGLGGTPRAHGNRLDGVAPHSTFRCADDRWVAIACSTDSQWHSLAGVLGFTDPRFIRAEFRSVATDELEAQLAQVIVQWHSNELVDALSAAGVPHSRVKDSRDIVEDAVLWRRGFWRAIEHPIIGPIPISRSPFRSTDGVELPVTRPPLLGEQTWDVLSEELGMTREEHDSLVAEEVLI